MKEEETICQFCERVLSQCNCRFVLFDRRPKLVLKGKSKHLKDYLKTVQG